MENFTLYFQLLIYRNLIVEQFVSKMSIPAPAVK